jgi:hypothetical protein
MDARTKARLAQPGTLRVVTILCLVLLALFAIVQVAHVHSDETAADHCPLCISMHSAAPVLRRLLRSKPSFVITNPSFSFVPLPQAARASLRIFTTNFTCTLPPFFERGAGIGVAVDPLKIWWNLRERSQCSEAAA